MIDKIKSNWFDIILYLPVISMFIATFFVPAWDKKVVIFFLIAIISICYKYGFNTFKDNYKDPYVIILIITTIYGSLLYETIGYGSGEIRTLIILTLYFLFFPKEKITLKGIEYLFIISAIVTFIYTIYFNVYLNIPRNRQPINAIPFAITLCLLAIPALYFFLEKKKKIMLAAYLLLSTSIFITETRGAIAPLLLTSLFILSHKAIERKKAKKLILASFLGGLIIIFFSFSFVNARVNETISEIKSISNGNYNTSIGLRLQMWQASPKLIAISPLWGLGDSHKKELQKLYQLKEINRSLASYAPTHYHNQYIDKTVKSGFIGVVLFLLCLYYPVYSCLKRNNTYRICIISIAIVFSLSCLTDTPFSQAFTLLPLLLSNFFILNAGKS